MIKMHNFSTAIQFDSRVKSYKCQTVFNTALLYSLIDFRLIDFDIYFNNLYSLCINPK